MIRTASAPYPAEPKGTTVVCESTLAATAMRWLANYAFSH